VQDDALVVVYVGRLAPFDRMTDPSLSYDGRPPALLEGEGMLAQEMEIEEPRPGPGFGRGEA
jgi:hypothetical protein